MSAEAAQSAGASIRVGLVDDDVLFRTGASQIISGAGSVILAFAVGTVQDYWSQTGVADVVLVGKLNGQWPAVVGRDGVEDRRCRFIMLIDGPTVSELTSYREAGISLCLRRETDGPGLIKAVVRASAMPGIDLTHRATIPVAIGHNGHRQGDLFNNDPAGVGTLNSREIEILDAIARGFSNKTIGSHFGISDQTVKNRLTGILRKLHATDRTEAVVIAFRRGWLDVVGFKGSETLPVVSNDQP